MRRDKAEVPPAGLEGISTAFPLFPLDLPLAFTIGGILPFFLMTSGNDSDGALDNAGSVRILLHIAEVLQKSPPRNTTVHLLFTGGGEVGLRGAFVFLRRHRQQMNREKCWLTNLDCVGGKGKIQVICQNGIPFHFQGSGDIPREPRLDTLETS